MISADLLRLFPGTGGIRRTAWSGRGSGRPLPRLYSGWILGSAIVMAVAVGAVAALGPLETILGVLVVLLLAGVCKWPAMAAYLVVLVTPVTVGMSTGGSLPLRPNEVLDVLVAAGLAARGLARLRAGRIPRLRLDGVEWSIVLMAVCSSALPLLWMSVRQQQMSKDDLLYALVMWKLLAVYAIVRLSVTSDRQIRRCLWLSVAAGSVVAMVGILQSLNLAGIPGLLTSYFSYSVTGPPTPGARASSTLGLPAATADLMIFNLAIVSGLWIRYRRHRVILASAAALFVFGALAAGEFSSAIGLVVALVCIAIVTSSPRLLALFVPAGLIGSGVLWSVIATRLSGFHSPGGLPNSWLGRLSNLRTYFWPKLFSDWNFVLGVRPAARVQTLTQNPGYVWIESGYTWLLWGGGIPLLASYVFFVVAAAKRGWMAARYAAGAASVAGTATFVGVLITTVLMVFDPHLTYRGSADALFALIALAAPRPASPRPAAPRTARPGISETSRTALRGGSKVTPENEGRSTATGAQTAWRSTALPDGNGHGSRGPEGSRAGPDSRVTGVNPAAGPRDPGARGQVPRFLRAHLASILVIAVAVTAGAALLARAQTPRYKSQATVVAYPSSTLAGAEAQASVMSTEQAVAQSSAVVKAASSRLHVPATALRHGLSVSAPATSYLLNISYTNPSPQVAQRRAQAIADAYVAYRARTLRAAEKASRTTAVAPQGGAVAAGVVNPASLPDAPSSPNRALDTGAGLILGVVLGLGFALARDRADDRLRGPSDLEERSGARVLAVIPGPADGLAVVRNPGSRSADAYRDLRIRVVQAAAWQNARTILVASPERQDEALVSANLAAALALAGRRVVLICADPRRSRVPDLFHLTGRAGLTSVFDGEATLADAIQRTEVPGLGILLIGPGSGGEAAVTHTSELRSVINGIRARTDFVIMDAPGVLADPVPSVLAELADMVLLAADARRSTRTSVLAAVREMERVHGALDGCVLTHVGPRSLIAAQRSLTRARRSVARPRSQWSTERMRLATSRVAGRFRRLERRSDLIRFPGRDPGEGG